MSSRVVRVSVLIAGLSAVAGAVALATAGGESGRLDRGFGERGTQTLAIPQAGEYFDYAGSEAVTTDAAGRILIAGSSSEDNGESGDDYRLVVVRLERDGSVDRSFARRGRYVGPCCDATGIAVQENGRIVVSRGGSNGLEAFRLTRAGALDRDFGRNGTATVGEDLYADDLAIDSAGRIAVMGQTDANHFAAARFTPDGEPDPRFGNDGLAVLDAGDQVFSNDGVIGPDDEVYVAGTDVEGSGDRMAIAGFDSAGDPLGGFGEDGLATVEEVSPAGLSGVVTDEGSLLLSGTRGRGANQEAVLVMLGARSGRVVERFGRGGVLTTDFASDEKAFGADVSVRRGGRIVLAGRVGVGPGVRLAAFRRNGARATAFGRRGFAVGRAPFLPGAMSKRRTGRIIVAGRDRDRLAVAAYRD